MAQGSQEQGAEFEQLWCELLGRVLKQDLGFEVLQNSVQSSGIQYGKDVQTRWRDHDGHDCFWHFECKSHRNGVLHQREVVDKLLDVYLSSHPIQVWCLTLAHIEPGNWIDERFAWANESLNLPFAVALLSPARGFVRDVFACHPDLFERLYGSPIPEQDGEARARTIAAFASLLKETTARGRELGLRPHGEWSLVAPARIRQQPMGIGQRRAYLRGLLPTCPWEAIVHGWTIAREDEASLLRKIEASETGFSFHCVVAAGGEGKSTLLRRVAWSLATADEPWTVLWTDVVTAREPPAFPTAWVESLAPSSRVLVCVDGSRNVTSLESAAAAHLGLRDEKKKVALLMTDRGHDWVRSPARHSLQGARLRPDQQKIGLAPLLSGEQEALVGLLSLSGLLSAGSLDSAVGLLREAALAASREPDKPYLLPTLMQLTDPGERGFEAILESVLSDLSGAGERESLRLLLATSLAHGAGFGLPRSLALRLAGTHDALAHGRALLDAELQVQLGNALAGVEGDDRFFAHHAVVADGLVSAAAESGEQGPSLLAVCSELPAHVKPDREVDLRIPTPLFDLLDAVAKHLQKDLHIYHAAAEFLSAWYGTDRRLFPNLHRLGECNMEWLQEELRRSSVDEELVSQLISRAREAYRTAISVAHTVLRSDDAPQWFRDYDLRDVEVKTYHSWGVLEGTAAMHSQDAAERHALLLRSVQLLLLSFEPNRRSENAILCGILALTLINLGFLAEAAEVVAASIELRRGTGKHIVARQRSMLRNRGVEVPGGGVELLDGVFASLSTGSLIEEWQAIGLRETRLQQIGDLLEILHRARVGLPSHREIDRAVEALEA